MKLVNDKGITVLEGDNLKHIIAQCLVYFECTEFWFDNVNKRFMLLGVEGDIID